MKSIDLRVRSIFWSNVYPLLHSLFHRVKLSYVRRNYSDSYDALESISGTVSVIIPTFNRSNLLFSRSIPSVLSQTYSDIELIVVSHGCTDDTDEKVTKLAQVDKRVRLVSIKRKRLGYPPSAENHWLVGPVKPIVAGLKEAKGKWIARIDDDDEWLPGHLQTLLEILVEEKSEFASSAYRAISDSDDKVIKPNGNPKIGGVQTWVYRAYLSFFRPNVNSWKKSWNRNNDTDLIDQMIRSGVKTTSSNDVTVLIRARPGEEFIGSQAYLTKPAKYLLDYEIKKESS